MARGHKNAIGCSIWFIVLAGGIGLMQMFSTKREPPRPQAVVPVPAPVVKVPPPAASSTVTKGKPTEDTPQDPNAKKPSTARARVLLACGRNLEKMDKKEGAIYYYRQVVMECRGTPESDEAITRLKALGGTVPELAESIPPKEGDPYVPPKGRSRHHYASSEAARQAFDQMLSQGMQAAINDSNGQGYSRGTPGAGAGGSHLCGAPTGDGTACRNPVQGGGYCHLHR